MKSLFALLVAIAAIQCVHIGSAFAASSCDQNLVGHSAYALDDKSYAIDGDTLTLNLVVANYLCAESQGHYAWIPHHPLDTLTLPSPVGGQYDVHFLKADALLVNANYLPLAQEPVQNDLRQTFTFTLSIKDTFGSAKTGRVIFMERFFTRTERKGTSAPQTPYTGGEYTLDLNLK